MNAVHLQLSEELQQFVTGQVEAGRFENSAAYIEALIEQARRGNEGVEALLLAGLDSGEPIPLDKNEWSRIRAEVEQRLTNGN